MQEADLARSPRWTNNYLAQLSTFSPPEGPMPTTSPPTATMSAETSLSLSRIGQIAIVVKDVERSTAFYRDALGMRFLFAFPGLAFFDCDGVHIMLSRGE